MAEMIDDEGEVYIIVPPVEEMQGKISDLFLTALSSHGYEVVRSEIVNGKAVALAKIRPEYLSPFSSIRPQKRSR